MEGGLGPPLLKSFPLRNFIFFSRSFFYLAEFPPCSVCIPPEYEYLIWDFFLNFPVNLYPLLSFTNRDRTRKGHSYWGAFSPQFACFFAQYFHVPDFSDSCFQICEL